MCGIQGSSSSAADSDSNASLAPNGSVNSFDGESVSSLLELAANNDLEAFKEAVEDNGARVDVSGSWYCRSYGSKKMVWLQRTPAMIAASYGSLDVLRYILEHISVHGGNINQVCGPDGSTALHCAAAGASSNVIETIKVLLSHGADPTIADAQGRQPFHLMGDCKLPLQKSVEKKMLSNGWIHHEKKPQYTCSESVNGQLSPRSETIDNSLDGFQCMGDANVVEPLSGFSMNPTTTGVSTRSWGSLSPSSSPKAFGDGTHKTNSESGREYPADPSLPDIKNGIYATDEFRMFSFKIRPCSRAYSHDWTECPFVHPGENARRRDPRRYHYSCVPCPEFRKGACRNGDACEYAHGIFESWLHPAQYRTRLCKDGTGCSRRVCFFAHTKEELRPLLSSEFALASSKAMSLTDLHILSSSSSPASPSSMPLVQSFSLVNTPPMSPTSVNSPRHGSWAQPGMPLLQLPGSNSVQASRLRAALSARDLGLEETSRLSDVEGHFPDEVASPPVHTRLNNITYDGSSYGTARSGKYHSMGLNLSSANMDDVSTSNIVSSPRSPLQLCLQSSGCGSPSARSAKYQQFGLNVSPSGLEDFLSSTVSASPKFSSQRSVYSPFEDPQMLKPVCVPRIYTQIQSSPGETSPTVAYMHKEPHQSRCCQEASTMKPAVALSHISGSPTNGFCRDLDLHCDTGGASSLPLEAVTPTAARPILLQRDKSSQGSRASEAGLLSSDWGSPTGKPQWSFNGDDITRLRQSIKLKGLVKPDLPQAQKAMNDRPVDNGLPSMTCSVRLTPSKSDAEHLLLGSWMEQVRMDQIAA